MATAKVKYFFELTELKNITGMQNKEFSELYPGVKGVRYDSFKKYVGHPFTGSDVLLPVTRIIEYQKNPSLHKCDARCQNAKGKKCECSCGGELHGINA